MNDPVDEALAVIGEVQRHRRVMSPEGRPVTTPSFSQPLAKSSIALGCPFFITSRTTW